MFRSLRSACSQTVYGKLLMLAWVRCAASKGSGGVISIQLEIDGSYSELGETGGKVKLAPAKITLNDCLACNGCITSAGIYKKDLFI